MVLFDGRGSLPSLLRSSQFAYLKKEEKGIKKIKREERGLKLGYLDADRCSTVVDEVLTCR